MRTFKIDESRDNARYAFAVFWVPPSMLDWIRNVFAEVNRRSAATPMDDDGLSEVFNRRSGPISAAISITIDAPAGAA